MQGILNPRGPVEAFPPKGLEVPGGPEWSFSHQGSLVKACIVLTRCCIHHLQGTHLQEYGRAPYEYSDQNRESLSLHKLSHHPDMYCRREGGRRGETMPFTHNNKHGVVRKSTQIQTTQIYIHTSIHICPCALRVHTSSRCIHTGLRC